MQIDKQTLKEKRMFSSSNYDLTLNILRVNKLQSNSIKKEKPQKHEAIFVFQYKQKSKRISKQKKEFTGT